MLGDDVSFCWLQVLSPCSEHHSWHTEAWWVVVLWCGQPSCTWILRFSTKLQNCNDNNPVPNKWKHKHRLKSWPHRVKNYLVRSTEGGRWPAFYDFHCSWISTFWTWKWLCKGSFIRNNHFITCLYIIKILWNDNCSPSKSLQCLDGYGCYQQL